MPDWSVPGYTELRTLGSGGFGDVVLARHDTSGVLVAIKYLRQDLLADQVFVAMFRSEAQVLASLDSPNVVQLYEYVESPSGAAIVMELVEGVSLREILTRQGHTTAEAALVVLQGSLLGLAAAHRRGIVHRDYKPENVLVNGVGSSKLTDFGLASRAGQQTIPGGTLMYAPPEQFAGAPASPAGDVYSATATFYECLVGHPPFSGEAAELLHKHRFEPVPLGPVPEPLRPLVVVGMEKDPGLRPADASTFVAQLRAVASDAYGPGWEERGRSHLGAAALLLAAALWPAGSPPAVQAAAVHRIALLRHLSPARIAITVGVATGVAAVGTALAVSGSHPPSSSSHHRTVPVSSSPFSSAPASSAPASSAPVSSAPASSAPASSAPVSSAPVSLAPVSSPPSSSPPCQPVITSVSAFAAAQTQTVTIQGSCLGSNDPYSESDSDYLRISDEPASWNGCWTGDPGTDQVTCSVTSWTPTSVTFSGFSGGYGQGSWFVSDGDQIDVQVWNPQSGNGPAVCVVVAGGEGNSSC